MTANPKTITPAHARCRSRSHHGDQLVSLQLARVDDDRLCLVGALNVHDLLRAGVM